MTRRTKVFRDAILALALIGLAAPSRAWRRRWVAEPRVVVGVGVGPFWGYPWYPYDPYFYGWYPYPYYGPPHDPYADADEAPADLRYDLKSIESRIAERRKAVKRDYEDGDISADMRDARLKRLDLISQEAKDRADANGGYLTRAEVNALLRQLRGESAPLPAVKSKEAAVPSAVSAAPSGLASPGAVSEPGLAAVGKLQLELRNLLDRKLKDGDITKAQYDGETRYLEELHEQERSQAAAGGGAPTSDEIAALITKLEREYYRINHNFIGQ